MSRTNTAAYESIKASQITFQNPDRTFPEPGAALIIDTLRGATAWSRDIDMKSLTLSGSSSTGVLTYQNQLLVNGNPIGGGGGADISAGTNIRVDSVSGTQRVSLSVREDVDMSLNSIINCKSIELPRIPNTSSAKITFGNLADATYGIISYEDSINTLLITSDTNIELRGLFGTANVGLDGISMEALNNKKITGIIKSDVGQKVSSIELDLSNSFIIGATDISSANPTLVLKTDVSQGLISLNRSGEMRFTADSYAMNTVPVANPVLPNVLSYDTATGQIKRQAATNGISALSTYTFREVSALDISGSASLGTYTPSVSGIYGINFVIEITNNATTPIVFDNTRDAFELLVWDGSATVPPPIKITSIQNRLAGAANTQKGTYTTSIYQELTAGKSYTIIAGNENVSKTCNWYVCFAEVRIVKLC